MAERPKKKTIRTIPRERTPVREQDPLERVKNFAEVSAGYRREDALREAERCLVCPDQPCIAGCPVNVNIPGFIQRIGQQDFRGAYDVITATNLLPAVCGRVCPQETQCEGVCLRGKTGRPVAIGHLERFVADWAQAHPEALAGNGVAPSGRSVAIVGSGPAGLTAAGELAKRGHQVTVFEAFHAAGGVLVYGIPEFRLPKDIVQAEIDRLQGELDAVSARLAELEEGHGGEEGVFAEFDKVSKQSVAARLEEIEGDAEAKDEAVVLAEWMKRNGEEAGLKKRIKQAEAPAWQADWDVRAGGNYRLVLRDSRGTDYTVQGVYREVEPNARRYFAKLFGVAGRLRCTQQGSYYLFEVEVEGPPVHDPDYRRAVKRDFRTRFVEPGFGPSAQLTRFDGILKAGTNEDGTPAEQWLVMPSVPSTAALWK